MIRNLTQLRLHELQLFVVELKPGFQQIQPFWQQIDGYEAVLDADCARPTL